MTQTETILLQLVAKSVNPEYKVNHGDFDNVNWGEVFQLSKRQGVAGIVLDAINTMPEVCNLPKSILLRWISFVLSMEKQYDLHRNVILNLAELYANNGFRMMLLKGYGLSLCWPIPNHRPVGDIDIYLGKDGQEQVFGGNVCEIADDFIAKSTGVEIDTSHHHHSVFRYKGITVENHFDFINQYDHYSSKLIEKKFKQMVSESYCYSNDSRNLYFPSTEFNALFILKHCSSHFASTEITVRQILDWMLFVRYHKSEINWRSMYLKYKDLGLVRMANILSAIAVKYLGFNKEEFYEFEGNQHLVDRVICDVLDPEFNEYEDGTFINGIWVKFRRFWTNSWKHKLCYTDSMLSAFLYGVYSKLLKPKHFKE